SGGIAGWSSGYQSGGAKRSRSSLNANDLVLPGSACILPSSFGGASPGGLTGNAQAGGLAMGGPSARATDPAAMATAADASNRMLDNFLISVVLPKIAGRHP